MRQRPPSGGSARLFARLRRLIRPTDRTPRPAAPPAVPPVLRAVRGGRGAGPLALVADDNEACRLITARMLESLGCRALTAPDGLDAVALAQGHAPDLVLLDLFMPGLDGFAAAAAMRRDAARAGLAPRILAVTGADEADLHAAAFEAGCDAVLLKPLGLDALADALGALGTALAAKRDGTDKA